MENYCTGNFSKIIRQQNGDGRADGNHISVNMYGVIHAKSEFIFFQNKIEIQVKKIKNTIGTIIPYMNTVTHVFWCRRCCVLCVSGGDNRI